VLQTAQPSRLFYFNNELRLDNTVERKTNQNIYITSDEKLKGDCFIENSIFSTSSPVSDTFIPRRNQKSNNRPNLIRESASH
jgi:hypothetical protein